MIIINKKINLNELKSMQRWRLISVAKLEYCKIGTHKIVGKWMVICC